MTIAKAPAASQPDVVDISDFYFHSIADSSSTVCSTRTDEQTNLHEEESRQKQQQRQQQQQLLLDNLCTYGWSPISVQVSADQSGLQNHRFWRSEILQFFQNEEWMTQYGSHEKRSTLAQVWGLSFRTSESGSATATTIEPKASWEYKQPSRDTSTAFQKNEHRDECKENIKLLSRRMHEFYMVCYNITCAIVRMLDFPEIFLGPSPVPLTNEQTFPSKSSSSLGALSSLNSLDLLRAFCYEPVTSIPDCMGSSPHTDWGSLTVVYQDSVGGLQTYDKIHQAWMDVPNCQNACDDKVEFIVHVGDLTSIAINRALLSVNMTTEKANDETLLQSTKMTKSVSKMNPVLFPSPLHRVLSPRYEQRISLVYFAYPSPSKTLNDLIIACSKWILEGSELDEARAKQCSSFVPLSYYREIPCEDYFLLRNQEQSSSKNHDDSHAGYRKPSTSSPSASELEFNKILHRPFSEVFQKKWKQVQR